MYQFCKLSVHAARTLLKEKKKSAKLKHKE